MLEVLIESVVIDRATHVLPEQVEQSWVFNVLLQVREQDVVVDAGVIAFHIGAKDKLVFRQLCQDFSFDTGV